VKSEKKDFWSSYLDDYDLIVQNSPSYNRMMSDIIEIIGEFRGDILKRRASRLLDAGTGTGNFLDRFKSLFPYVEVWGIDNQAEIISYLEKKFFGRRVHLQNIDLDSSTPFKKNYFSIVVCLSVIWDVQSPEMLLREFNRILKRKEGLLILTYPRKGSNRLKIFFSDLRHGLLNKMIRNPRIISSFLVNIKRRYFSLRLRYFFQNDIRCLLEKTNFHIIDCRLTYSDQFELIIARAE